MSSRLSSLLHAGLAGDTAGVDALVAATTRTADRVTVLRALLALTTWEGAARPGVLAPTWTTDPARAVVTAELAAFAGGRFFAEETRALVAGFASSFATATDPHTVASRLAAGAAEAWTAADNDVYAARDRIDGETSSRRAALAAAATAAVWQATGRRCLLVPFGALVDGIAGVTVSALVDDLVLLTAVLERQVPASLHGSAHGPDDPVAGLAGHLVVASAAGDHARVWMLRDLALSDPDPLVAGALVTELATRSARADEVAALTVGGHPGSLIAALAPGPFPVFTGADPDVARFAEMVVHHRRGNSAAVADVIKPVLVDAVAAARLVSAGARLTVEVVQRCTTDPGGYVAGLAEQSPHAEAAGLLTDVLEGRPLGRVDPSDVPALVGTFLGVVTSVAGEAVEDVVVAAAHAVGDHRAG